MRVRGGFESDDTGGDAFFLFLYDTKALFIQK